MRAAPMRHARQPHSRTANMYPRAANPHSCMPNQLKHARNFVKKKCPQNIPKLTLKFKSILNPPKVPIQYHTKMPHIIFIAANNQPLPQQSQNILKIYQIFFTLMQLNVVICDKIIH